MLTQYAYFGYGLGIDLWLIQISLGSYLMLYNSEITMNSCFIYEKVSYNSSSELKSNCEKNKKTIILDKNRIEGLSYGMFISYGIDLFSNENFKITWGNDNRLKSFGFYDFSGNLINYKGLNIYQDILVKDGTRSTTETLNGLRIIYYFR